MLNDRSHPRPCNKLTSACLPRGRPAARSENRARTTKRDRACTRGVRASQGLQQRSRTPWFEGGKTYALSVDELFIIMESGFQRSSRGAIFSCGRRGLERDPLRAMRLGNRCTSYSPGSALTILTIDRDPPPRLPLPLEVAARDERAGTTLRASVDSPCSISPGRCIISAWDERA